MLKSWWLPVAVAAICSGCTTVSLNNYTLDQIHSIEEYRVNTTLDCLASVAASPDTFPSFALLAAGTTHLTDTGSVNSITSWTRLLKGFSTESFGLSANRSPEGQWTVDPVSSFSQLDALRAACRWAVFGPDAAWNESPRLLLDPVSDYSPLEPRFGVASRLEKLPPKWLHAGCKSSVPKRAAYKARCGETWIWVMPEEKWCFSEFILILHDIATVDPNVGVYSKPLIVTITREFPITYPPVSLPGKSESGGAQSPPPKLTFKEFRIVKPEYRQRIEQKLAEVHNYGGTVAISEEQWMEATYSYNGTRTASNAAAAAEGSPNNGASGSQSQQRLVPEMRNINAPELRIRDLPPEPTHLHD